MNAHRRTALGIGWLLWRRHRWGLGVVTMMLCVATLVARVGPWGPPMMAALLMPLGLALVYLVTVFVFEGKDLAARESGFPSYLWTLPVRTVELVGWPMGLGVVAVALGWVLLAELVMRPLGMEAAVGWPAMLMGAVVASVQAMLWVSWPVPFARVVGLCCVVVGLVTVGLGGREAWGISERALVVIYGIVIVGAFVVALRGVGRARHGEGARWQWVPWLVLGGEDSGVVRRGRAFASPAGAQLWMEWRRNGVMLVLACCGMWVLMLTPLMWQWRYGEGLLEVDGNKIVMQLGTLLAVPVLLSMVMGAGPRRSLSSRRDLSMSSFMAARPIGVGTFVGAKLWGAALSTGLVWGVGLVMIALLMLFPVRIAGGTAPMGAVVAEVATGRQVVIACAAIAGVVALTWKFQVEGICMELFGRGWVAQSYSVALGMLLVGGCVVGAWMLGRPDAWEAAGRVGWRVGCVLCVAKVGLGVWVLRTSVGRGLMKGRAAWWWGLAWLAGVVAVCSVAWALAPREMVSGGTVVVAAILAAPLVRLAAGPLALASNRHR